MATHQHLPLRRALGGRLRSLRENAGIGSQEKLAERAGLHRTYIGRLERGETGVTVESLAAILGAMSIPLAQFFRPFTTPLRPPMPRGRE